MLILTLGVFSLVISAWMLLVTDWMMETLTVDGFGAAFAGAIVIAIVNILLDLAADSTGLGKDRVGGKLPEAGIVVGGQVEGDGWIEHGAAKEEGRPSTSTPEPAS